MRIPNGARIILASTLTFLPAAAGADSRAQKYYYEDITRPFFAPDPDRPGVYRSQRPGAVPSSFTVVKAPNAFRVFVLGGSIAQLLRSNGRRGDFEQALAAVLPAKTVEVLNCGMPGYDSYREALIEQEVLEYSPDLIVFLTGHNEGIASAPIPIWIMKTQERLSRLGAFRALVEKLRPAPSPAVPHTDARADERDAAFAKNLAQNIRQARTRGVKVAVVVPPRNYREPPEVAHMLYDAEFVPGWLVFLRGDFAAARRAWRTGLEAPARGVVADSPRKAFTWGFIARGEEKLGLWAEARDSFERAAQFDRAAICGPLCQDIIRRAAGDEGGVLVEADRMFRALASPRLPGMETFNDRMHWKPKFNCLMSAEIIDALRRDHELGALPWDAARIKELGASCEKPGEPASEDDDLRILSYVLMGLSWPEFSQLSTVSVFYLQAIHQRRPSWFKDVPALMKKTENPQTQSYGLAMAPDSVVLPRLYWHIGEVRLIEKDYAGAIRDFRKALQLEPKLSWARLSLAVAIALAGDKKLALGELKAAMDGSPPGKKRDDLLASAVAIAKTLGLDAEKELESGTPGHWLALAEAAVSTGRREAALEALNKARALKPQPHELRSIEQSYRRLGDKVQVFRLTEELLVLYPEDADLWLDRADAAFAAGLRTVGTEAASQAARLRPAAVERKLDPEGAERWLAQAEIALSSAQPRAALAALDRAREANPQPHELRLIAQRYRGLGEHAKSFALSERLLTLYPADADLWIDRAEMALATGQRAMGAQALARAESFALSPDQRRRVARQRVLESAPAEGKK